MTIVRSHLYVYAVIAGRRWPAVTARLACSAAFPLCPSALFDSLLEIACQQLELAEVVVVAHDASMISIAMRSGPSIIAVRPSTPSAVPNVTATPRSRRLVSTSSKSRHAIAK